MLIFTKLTCKQIKPTFTFLKCKRKKDSLTQLHLCTCYISAKAKLCAGILFHFGLIGGFGSQHH